MNIKKLLAFMALGCSSVAFAGTWTLSSPDNLIAVTIVSGDSLTYSAAFDGKQIILPSTVGLRLSSGREVGPGKATVADRRQVRRRIASPFYRSDSIPDNFNALTLNLPDKWKVEFRVYDDGVAYRFVNGNKKPLKIENELAAIRFASAANSWVPYVNVRDYSSFEKQFQNSFENTYTVGPLDSLDRKKLMFLPVVVQPEADGPKVLITETDLNNYPGMYLNATGNGGLNGVWATMPKSWHQGGHNRLQRIVDEREPYIADISGVRALPWRIAVIAPDDAALASTNLSYLLAEPSKVADASWIKPGKVAWDWWADWNLRNVDFESGINNLTYKAFIDFAARNGVEYVILDEGWAVNLEADLMKVVPEINLPELVAYGDSLGVGLILWAGYLAFDRDMENVCRHYADMGIKGFKVDFMDHDDQLMTEFNHRAAETTARYGLLLDLHGTHKPAGLHRTWPNVINFEGVHGMEQMKWSSPAVDQVTYDVQIPFIRQAAGPMDYTQGAMRNATRRDYRPVNDDPMSQGTRAHQLAMYMVFDSPLTMMCDTPMNYDDNPESRDFICSVPTVWDETRILDGKIGEYIVTARRKGTEWFVGGMTDWTPRDVELDLSFIGGGSAVKMLTDGANAHRNARDLKVKDLTLSSDGKISIHMAPGGGFAIKTI